MAYDANDEGDKKILEDAITAAVAGLKSKNDELIGKQHKMKTRLDELTTTFEGIDPVAVKSMLSRVANDEEAKLIAEGKIDDVVNRRVDRMKLDYENKLKDKDKELEKTRNFGMRFREQVLSGSIRDAAIKAGVLPEAIDDVVLRARNTFSVNEDGETVALRNNEAILGKDGKTPLTPAEWVDGIRETARHLWPQAAGGNADGGGGKATKKFSELSETERVALYRNNPIEYARVRDADKPT